MTSTDINQKPYTLAVKAVILDSQNRCLLLRRSNACRSLVGQWEWPGGKPDPGESFTETLSREVREETGLEIELTGLAGASTFEMPVARVVLICMIARATSGELRLSSEHDDSAWVPLAELPGWNVVTPMKPVIQNLLTPAQPNV